jgi:hypothetical protein
MTTVHVQDMYHINATAKTLAGAEQDTFLIKVKQRLRQWKFPTTAQVCWPRYVRPSPSRNGEVMFGSDGGSKNIPHPWVWGTALGSGNVTFHFLGLVPKTGRVTSRRQLALICPERRAHE